MSDRDLNGPDGEYQALRNGSGFVELADWSSVLIRGADRQTFLHNFCTNDVKRLNAGESCEAFITNVKGKIVGHGLIACGHSQLIIVGSPGQSQRLIAHLERYVIREDVHFQDMTDESIYVLETSEQAFSRKELREWKLLGSTPCGLRQLGRSGWPELRQSIVSGGLVECGLAAFDTLRIEAGTPLFGVDFDENNLPQEVGRDAAAISFTKGCYLGQETVARIDALGHVNQKIVGVKFSGREVPAAATELTHAGAKAGYVTSATFSPKLSAPLALAMVRREHTAVGSRLNSVAGECEVVELLLR